MPKISYVNGNFVAHENAMIHIEDRGYQFSDGVYEVVMAKDGVLIDWNEHCARLERSLSEMHIGYFFHEDALKNLARELLARNNLKDATLYIQITRGVSAREHAFPTNGCRPSVVMTATAFKPADRLCYEEGVAAITARDIRWKRRDIKTISLLPNILAKQQAVAAKATEVILIEDDGYITEGSSTNVFITDDEGIIYTHPANNRILCGITRNGVIAVAQSAGFKVKQEMFNKSRLLSARGVFMTSTTKHIMPVTKIDGQPVAGEEICGHIKKLIKIYEKYIQKQVADAR